MEGGAQESRYEVVETELISSVEVGNSEKQSYSNNKTLLVIIKQGTADIQSSFLIDWVTAPGQV